MDLLAEARAERPYRSVVVAGAGCSKGVLGVPASEDYGELLHRSHPDWPDRYPALAVVLDELADMLPGVSRTSWALDVVWGTIDNRTKLWRATRHGDFGPTVGLELRRTLCDVYGPSLAPRIAEALADRDSDLHRTLARARRPTLVVSFNYDLLLDAFAHELGLDLVKPHGSLDWRQIVPDDGALPERLDRAMSPDEVRREGDHLVKPAVIGPVPFKSEITVEVQAATASTGFHRLLTKQWSAIVDALASCEQLFVLGYGFPPEDVHATHMFREAALERRRHRVAPLELEIHQGGSDSFECVREHLAAIFFRENELALHPENKGPIGKVARISRDPFGSGDAAR